MLRRVNRVLAVKPIDFPFVISHFSFAIEKPLLQAIEAYIISGVSEVSLDVC